MIPRAIDGVLLAATMAVGARCAGALTSSGAVAAAVVGTAAVAVGWSWGVLLLVYFAASTLLSRVGRAAKEQRTARIIEKAGARDAVQVLANGGLFTGGAVAMLVRPDIRWLVLAAASLAASAADTWATEVGTLWGGEPRSLLSWRRVPPGTSGGITTVGSLAAIAGAVFIGLVMAALGWTTSIAVHVAIGGLFGAFVDSFVGAAAQAQRWCVACELHTERMTHDCGAPTMPRSGLSWMDNDVVNFISIACGALLAVALTR